MATLTITRLREYSRDGEHFASARIAGEEVWFSCRKLKLKASPEAFLSAFLIAAQHQGDRLACPEPVCPVWQENTRQLLHVTADWWRLRDLAPLVTTVEKPPARRWRRKAALFFTGGVDSFHTLLHHRQKPHALVNVQGFDIPLENERRQQEATLSLRAISHAQGIRLIPIRTNLRQHSYFKKASWEHTHGGALAAVAHLLEETYQDFTLSSSTRRTDPRAWGSSWRIDRFWSSATMRFGSWGEDLSRAEKLERIASHPLVRDHLRVCWKSHAASANCGRCAKCTSTLVALTWAGRLDLLKHRFDTVPYLPGAVKRWQRNPISSPEELDPVHMRPERLEEPLRTAIITRRTALLGTIRHGVPAGASCVPPQLLDDTFYQHLMGLSAGHTVFYHKVQGNVGDDLIHAAALQLFERHGITLTDRIEEADQVVLCGGGSIGIWDGCARMREEIYNCCRELGITAILHPQSVGGPDEVLPDLVTHRFVREWRSLPEMPGARLMPDMALGYRPTRDYGPPLYQTGWFLRNDPEGLFPDLPFNIGDPPRLIPRDLDNYFQLAAGYRHLVTDRLHFAIIGLILGRRVTLLPNLYHKNLGMWETWLKDLGCEWADSPDQVASPTPPVVSAPPPRIGMVVIAPDPGKTLETHLRYHRAVGVDIAWLFIDDSAEDFEEIAAAYPWVRLVRSPHPAAHRRALMDEALRLAREESLDWLLAADPGEFAFANHHLSTGSVDPEDLACLTDGLEKSKQVRQWLRANLKCLLREVPPETQQVILGTREALPLQQPPGAPFWEQDLFVTHGPHPLEITDPETGGPGKGRPIVRTSARLQALDGQAWTKWQGANPPDSPLDFPIPTRHHGWHARYPIATAVRIPRETAELWRSTLPGVIHQPVFSQLLRELETRAQSEDA
jgi:Glycosyl transferase family 2/Polysaccharide pyruvyl transferase